MRVFELSTHVKSVSRGKGRSATAAAAYRACCVIECEREGKTHDYTRKQGLEASAIIVPGNAPAWAANRAKLWNAAELRERNGKRGANAGQFKADAVTAREFMFSFPVELSAAGRFNVAQTLARHLADTHGVAADFSIHMPGKEGDERNHHCHMLTTTRRLNGKGFGEKAREWTDLNRGAVLAKEFRALVAATMNAELAAEEKAGMVHVEHRSFKDRGTPQTPTKHQGVTKTNVVRKGQRRARDAWHQAEQKQQRDRHAKERAGQKTRHDFALSAKLGDLTERQRRGLAAIAADLKAAQAADRPPTGARRVFQIVTGKVMRDDFERQARMEQREQTAEQKTGDLKASLQAEKVAFLAAVAAETRMLADRHSVEDQQLTQAVDARREVDRAAEVQARRDQVQDITREREVTRQRPQERGIDFSP